MFIIIEWHYHWLANEWWPWRNVWFLWDARSKQWCFHISVSCEHRSTYRAPFYARLLRFSRENGNNMAQLVAYAMGQVGGILTKLKRVNTRAPMRCTEIEAVASMTISRLQCTMLCCSVSFNNTRRHIYSWNICVVRNTTCVHLPPAHVVELRDVIH